MPHVRFLGGEKGGAFRYTRQESDLPGNLVQSDRSLLHDIGCFNCGLMWLPSLRRRRPITQ